MKQLPEKYTTYVIMQSKSKWYPDLTLQVHEKQEAQGMYVLGFGNVVGHGIATLGI
jgi:hypothetical protein